MTINIDSTGAKAGSGNDEEKSHGRQVEKQPSFEGTLEQNGVKITLVPSKRKTVRKINMIIEGEFNIKNADFVKQNCLRLLGSFDMVGISLRKIEDIDLAAVQLLWVLTNTADLEDKIITIDSELSKEDKLLFENAGLTSLLSKQAAKN